ncbi:MAG: AAA family ATPase [Solirubrobacterales bacterium]
MFEKATKEQSRARITITGLSGAGKTYTSLQIATALAPGKVAVVDTERGRSKLLSDIFEFDVALLNDAHPTEAVKVMRQAHADGYEALVFDSGTRVWERTLELKEREARRGGVNDYTAWGVVGPLYDEFWTTVNELPIHIIVTLRAKMRHEISKNAQGKTTVEKLGVGPIVRAGSEYESDIGLDIDRETHTIYVDKSRWSALTGKVYPDGDTSELVDVLLSSLGDGEVAKETAQAAPRALMPTERSRVSDAVEEAATRLDCEREKVIQKVLDLCVAQKFDSGNFENAIDLCGRLIHDTENDALGLQRDEEGATE